LPAERNAADRHGAPVGEPAAGPLRVLFWESTSRCNLSCMHCRRQDVWPTAGHDEMATDQARGMLDDVAAMGQPLVIFSGGEPLMRDDWPVLAAHARAKGLPIALATNGTLIDADLAGRIAAAGFRRVAVSLDGADAQTHDTLRGVAGAFDAAVAGIAHLRAVGQAVQINATIAAHNAGQLDRLYELAESLEAEALHLFLLVPVGCGAKIAKTHQLAPNEYERVYEWVCRRRGGALELRPTCAPRYHVIAASHGQLPQHSVGSTASRGCLAGVAVAFVSHRGEVFPCGYLPASCGNVQRQSIGDIWRRSAVLGRLRNYDTLTGTCGRCEHKSLCGGCRARAYAARGDYLAGDPACAWKPGT